MWGCAVITRNLSLTEKRVELPQVDGQNVGSVDRDHVWLPVESGIVTLPTDPRHAGMLSAAEGVDMAETIDEKVLEVQTATPQAEMPSGWGRALMIGGLFGMLTLFGHLAGYPIREQPWWLRSICLLIAIPVGEAVMRGVLRLRMRGLCSSRNLTCRRRAPCWFCDLFSSSGTSLSAYLLRGPSWKQLA